MTQPPDLVLSTTDDASERGVDFIHDGIKIPDTNYSRFFHVLDHHSPWPVPRDYILKTSQRGKEAFLIRETLLNLLLPYHRSFAAFFTPCLISKVNESKDAEVGAFGILLNPVQHSSFNEFIEVASFRRNLQPSIIVYCYALASAIKHLSNFNIIHRDLRPQNTLLTTQVGLGMDHFWPVVLDLGISWLHTSMLDIPPPDGGLAATLTRYLHPKWNRRNPPPATHLSSQSWSGIDTFSIGVVINEATSPTLRSSSDLQIAVGIQDLSNLGNEIISRARLENDMPIALVINRLEQILLLSSERMYHLCKAADLSSGSPDSAQYLSKIRLCCGLINWLENSDILMPTPNEYTEWTSYTRDASLAMGLSTTVSSFIENRDIGAIAWAEIMKYLERENGPQRMEKSKLLLKIRGDKRRIDDPDNAKMADALSTLDSTTTKYERATFVIRAPLAAWFLGLTSIHAALTILNRAAPDGYLTQVASVLAGYNPGSDNPEQIINHAIVCWSRDKNTFSDDYANNEWKEELLLLMKYQPEFFRSSENEYTTDPEKTL